MGELEILQVQMNYRKSLLYNIQIIPKSQKKRFSNKKELCLFKPRKFLFPFLFCSFISNFVLSFSFSSFCSVIEFKK